MPGKRAGRLTDLGDAGQTLRPAWRLCDAGHM